MATSSEKTLIVDIDPRKITLRECRELAEIILASFSKTDLQQVMWGPEYTFAERPIPAERLPKYNALVTVDSWSLWLALRDENVRAFSAVKGGKPVGYCAWNLPAAKHTDTLPWLHKVQNYFIDVWIQVLNFWYFGWGHNPTELPEEVKQGAKTFRKEKQLVHDDPDQRRKELSEMPEEEFNEACFLQEDYYYCMDLCLHPSYQGQGVGGLLFRESIKRLEAKEILLNGVAKPARLGLIATRDGRPLYEKVGFKQMGIVSSEYKGTKIVGTPMQKIMSN